MMRAFFFRNGVVPAELRMLPLGRPTHHPSVREDVVGYPRAVAPLGRNRLVGRRERRLLLSPGKLLLPVDGNPVDLPMRGLGLWLLETRHDEP